MSACVMERTGIIMKRENSTRSFSGQYFYVNIGLKMACMWVKMLPYTIKI